MKKLLIFIAMSLFLISCSNKTEIELNNNVEEQVQKNFVEDFVNEYKDVEDGSLSFIAKIVDTLDNGDTLVMVSSEYDNSGYFKNNQIVNIGSTGDGIYMPQTNVKITYSGDIQETEPVQIMPISIDLLNSPSGYVKLEDLPEDYTTEDAIDDGCVVTIGDETYNFDVLLRFIDELKNGESSFYRSVNFTKEGCLILSEFKYVKGEGKIYVIEDSTRDRFTNKENRAIREFEYNNFIKLVNDDKTYVFIDKFLGKDKRILELFYSNLISNLDESNTALYIENSKREEDYALYISYDNYDAINEKVDWLLAVIMSSPKTASDPGSYINAHREEYEELIAMDKDVLRVLFPRLNTKNAGLKEIIEWRVCKEILAAEDIKVAVDTPQEWYNEYKSYLSNIYKQNSEDFIKENYPKASVLLEIIK